MENISDFSAMQKWNRIDKDIRDRLLANVYCSNCYNTIIIDYSVRDDVYGIVLQGKCKKCGADVARFVEREAYE